MKWKNKRGSSDGVRFVQQVCPAVGAGGTLLVVGWLSACHRRGTVISAAGTGSLLWICDIMDVSDGGGSGAGQAAGCSHCASRSEHDGLMPVTPCWELLWCDSCSCVQTFCSFPPVSLAIKLGSVEKSAKGAAGCAVSVWHIRLCPCRGGCS